MSAPESAPEPAPDAVVEQVRRWENSGGHWSVLTRTQARVSIGLFSCDGGELMDTLEGPLTPELVALLGAD